MVASDSLSPRRLPAAVALLALAGGALRLADIAAGRFAPDEGFSVMLATMSWGELIAETARDTHPPFYYMALKCWYGVFPATLESAQALSAILSMLTIGAVFALARFLFGTRAGLLAAATMAFAPYLIYWGHFARMHAMQPLWITLVLLGSFAYARTGLRRWWWLAAGAWLLAIQTNYMALVFGPVWALAFLLARDLSWRRRRMLYLATLPGLISFAAWLPVLRHHLQSGPMNASFFQETVSPIYLYYHAIFGAMEAYQPPQFGVAFLLCMAVFIAVVIGAGYRVQRHWTIWTLLLLTPTVPILVAKLAEWTLAERHLLFALPLFLVYWGAGLDYWIERFTRRSATAPLPSPTPR